MKRSLLSYAAALCLGLLSVQARCEPSQPGSAPAEAAGKGTVTVFAAASLTDAVTELAKRFESEGKGTLRVSFASSSTLARQIENGAPADLFLSADEEWMKYLDERSRVARDTWTRPIGNELVLVASLKSPPPAAAAPNPGTIERGFDLGALLGDGRLAVGDPDHVPAGRYARQALEHYDLWKLAEPRLARAENVRAALALVERGEAPLAIVYSTDARVAKGIRTIARFRSDSHEPILYSFAAVAERDNEQARAALAYLTAPAAVQLFREQGFRIP